MKKLLILLFISSSLFGQGFLTSELWGLKGTTIHPINPNWTMSLGGTTGLLKFASGQWQFSNDGTNYQAIPTSSGTVNGFTRRSSGSIYNTTVGDKVHIRTVAGDTTGTATLNVYGGVSIAGSGTFSGNVSVSTGVNTTISLGIGNQSITGDYAGLIKFYNTNTSHNWAIGNNSQVADNFEIIPSATVGGITFPTPVFRLTSAGDMSVSGGGYFNSTTRVASTGTTTFQLYNSDANSAGRNFDITTNNLAWGDFMIRQGTSQGASPTSSKFYINGAGTNTIIGTSLTLGATSGAGTQDFYAGAGTFGGAIKSTQFILSALNTAPASATATGTLGEIRYTATAMYVCTATNTWVKCTLATW